MELIFRRKFIRVADFVQEELVKQKLVQKER